MIITNIIIGILRIRRSQNNHRGWAHRNMTETLGIEEIVTLTRLALEDFCNDILHTIAY